jgi:TRAP-type C4-dicarboxylate transport system permease small subunit
VLKSALLFLALIYSILLDCYLIHYTFASYSREIVSTSLSQTPLYIPQLVMPIGMTLFVFELIKEWIYTLFNLLTADAPSNPKGGL